MLIARGRCIQGWLSCAALRWAVSGAATAAKSGPATSLADCHGCWKVGRNERVLLVNIEVGSSQASACASFECEGPAVSPISCFMEALNNALSGCPPPTVTTAGIVFNGEGNRLHAYQPGPGFPKQTVIPSA